MRAPDWESDGVSLYLGDCLDIVPMLEAGGVDAVVTDPPYPDYYTEDYQYRADSLDFLGRIDCRQFIFWSAKTDFPLDFTARHVWDKITGAACQYDFVYERNGHRRQKVFRGHRINSSVSAQFASEHFTGHKSQKPLNVVRALIEMATAPNATILDPFFGSGTTGVACVQTGRRFIGIEIDEGYFEIAKRRIIQAQSTPRLPGV